MAESTQERTELPTPEKLRRARERGEVWQSRDLTSAAILLAAMLALMGQAQALWGAVRDSSRACFTLASGGGPSVGEALSAAWGVFGAVAWPTLAVIVAATVAGGLCSFLQVRPLLAVEPLKPKLEKLNPLAGLKRQFFSMNTWVEFARTSAKAVAVGGICAAVVWGDRGNLLRLSTVPPEASGVRAWELALTMSARVLVFFVAVAALDLVYQRWNYMRQQKMSKDEIKREYKQREGDPEHKQARRRTHRQIAEGQMLMEVSSAHVVSRNPTHMAVALRYDPGREGAPRVVAKGKGGLALKIIEAAERAGVPVYTNIPLSRALYEVSLNHEVPEGMYEAVKEIFGWVDALMRDRGELPPWDASVRAGGSDAEGEADAGKAPTSV